MYKYVHVCCIFSTVIHPYEQQIVHSHKIHHLGGLYVLILQILHHQDIVDLHNYITPPGWIDVII